MNRDKRKRIREFLLNPRFLLCFGMAWMLTNGWAYAAFGLGTLLKNGWLLRIATAYLAFLWFPFTPEKIVTVTIAAFLLRWLFPEDEKTLKVLKDLWEKYRKKT